jgi:hypothetical protein
MCLFRYKTSLRYGLRLQLMKTVDILLCKNNSFTGTGTYLPGI